MISGFRSVNSHLMNVYQKVLLYLTKDIFINASTVAVMNQSIYIIENYYYLYTEKVKVIQKYTSFKSFFEDNLYETLIFLLKLNR